MLSTLFERCMKRRGVKETDPYDWEKLEGGPHSVSNMSSQNNMPSNIQSHIQVKTDQIHGGACMNSTGVIGVIATGNATTIGATNASGIEYVSTVDIKRQTTKLPLRPFQQTAHKIGQSFNLCISFVQMQVDKNCNATVTAPNNQLTTNTRAGNVIPSNGKNASF